MADFKINSFNIAAVNRAVDAAVDSVASVVDREMKSAIRAKVWNWPRPTRRKSGRIVGSPRDIVDQGALLNSQRMIRQGKRVLVYEWTAKHSLIVHFGLTTRKGTVVPGRPWTRLGLAKSNVQGVFVDSFRRNYK
jgi:hypothetical protein